MRDTPKGEPINDADREAQQSEGFNRLLYPPPAKKDGCPACGSRRIGDDFDPDIGLWYGCQDCGYAWNLRQE